MQEIKRKLEEQQYVLNETRKKLDRCDRSDEKYLLYVAEEHKLLLDGKDQLWEYYSLFRITLWRSIFLSIIIWDFSLLFQTILFLSLMMQCESTILQSNNNAIQAP